MSNIHIELTTAYSY